MLRDLDLHQRVRRVRRRPAARRQLQLGHELLLAHAEPPRHLADRRLPDLRQPPDHGEQPSQPPARLCSRRGSGLAAAPVPPSSDAAATTGSAGRPDVAASRPTPPATPPARRGTSLARSWWRGPTARAPTSGWRRTRDAEDQLDRAVVGALARPCPRRPGRRRGGLRRASTLMRISTARRCRRPRARRAAPPTSRRHRRAHRVRARPASRRPRSGRPGTSARPAVEVPRHEVPVAEAEPEADGATTRAAPVR